MKGAGAVKLALAAPAALLLAACTATSPAPRPSVPPPSVETVTGQALGAQAEAGPGGSVTFPALTFSGPVSTVSRDAVLGSPGGTQAFATPRGTLTVRYTAASAGSAPEAAGSGARPGCGAADRGRAQQRPLVHRAVSHHRRRAARSIRPRPST